MDEFTYNIEGDNLILTMVHKTERSNEFLIQKIPVMNKEAFQACYDEWIKGGEKDGIHATTE